MKISFFLILFFFTFNSIRCCGQVKSKSDLYLYFDTDSSQEKCFKTFEILTQKNKKTKHDVYLYGPMAGPTGKQINYVYIVKDPERFIFKDSLFVKRYTYTIGKVKADKAFTYDMDDKRFPYRHVYIVEFVTKNKFKVIEVTQYLGSRFDL